MSEIIGAEFPSSAITLKRIWVEYWPLQSAPASHVMVLAVPVSTPAPIAPLSVVAGTTKVDPPLLETCRLTETVGKSAATS
jgi:hypothetical protein